MVNISKMKSSELEKILAEAKDELTRRDSMIKALADIKKTLKRYKLRAEDFNWTELNKSTTTADKKESIAKLNPAFKKRTKLDQRSSVAPKYLNPKSKEKWTGRGRAPSWVVKICNQENIDLTEFKLDPRFKI